MRFQRDYFKKEFEKSDVEAICRDIVRIKSINPPGDEIFLAKYCQAYLDRLGFEVKLFAHAEERASVLARLKGRGAGTGVMICAHMDTVPLGEVSWQHDPLGGDISDGRVYGRGASDMKGGLAAALAAARVIVDSGVSLQGDLWIALTAGEEVDFLGAKEIARHREVLPLQVLLIPEPSSNEIYLAQKGALWLEVEMQGKTAHGSMPDLGVNAVEIMAQFIQRLKQIEFPFQPHPLLDSYTAAVTTIRGGIKMNIIPDRCSITIDIRTVPGQNHVNMRNQIKAVLKDLEKTEPGLKTRINIVKDLPAVVTEEKHPQVLPLREAVKAVLGREAPIKGVRYFTDSAVLAPAWNVPMIICGPGHADLAHQPDEYVEIKLLQEAVEIYTLAITSYL